jgi:phosphohistidine phosphatase
LADGCRSAARRLLLQTRGVTTRRLLLIRHAQTEPGEVDETRKLTHRGRRDAREIGRWLVANDLCPDLVVVSPARRARQTWEIAAAELPDEVRTAIDPRIYDNTVVHLLAVVADVEDTVSTLAVVGHNPSIESLTRRWVGDNRAFGGCSTASVGVFTVDVSWASLRDGADAALTDFVTCRG